MNDQCTSQALALRCHCGQVSGKVRCDGRVPGRHVVCYCKDCQAFARHLGQSGAVLDDYGGTELFQLPPARITLTGGDQQVRCLRLTDKGLYRWFAACCNTPIGNTGPASMPFVGLIHSFVADGPALRQHFGPVETRVFVSHANKAPPALEHRLKPQPLYMLSIVGNLIAWKLTGQGRPSPFFDSTGRPLFPVEVLARH